MSNDKSIIKVFQGVKFFWRTRNSLDIIIMEHTDSNITELIAFEPTIDKESPRIYMDSSVLHSKIDHASIEAQLSFAKRNNVPITEEWISAITNKAKADFLLSRLVIVEFGQETRSIEVILQVPTIDAEHGDDPKPLICEKPAELKPFRAAHQATLLEGVVSKALAAFETEKASLQAHTNKASAYQLQATQSGLTMRQRWRIPILFIKISKGCRLNPEDSAIWQHVTSHIRTEEDAARLTGVFDAALPLSVILYPGRKPSPKSAVGSTSTGSKLSPKHSPKNSSIPSFMNALYKATTASSRSKMQADQDELDHTPPTTRTCRASPKKATSKKNTGKSSKRPATAGRRTPKKRRQSNLDIVTNTSGDAADPIDGEALGSGDDLMRNTLDSFVSALGAISASFKSSFSIRRAAVMPIADGECECESGEGGAVSEEVTPMGAYMQPGDASFCYTNDFAEQTAPYTSRSIRRTISLEEVGATTAATPLDVTPQATAAAQAGTAQGGSAKVTAKRKASFFDSLRSLCIGVGEKYADCGMVRSDSAGNLKAGAEVTESGFASRGGSHKINVLPTVTQLIGALWGHSPKHSAPPPEYHSMPYEQRIITASAERSFHTDSVVE